MSTIFTPPAQLHNHSKFSLLDAVPSPEEWVHWCLETNTPAIAITDHGTAISMFHALRFSKYVESYNKAKGTSFNPKSVVGIPAVELYVKLFKEDKGHYHITVWAVSNEGYKNLMKLASLAYQDTVSYFGSTKARVTYEQILQYKEGLKFGTGCIAGPIGEAIIEGNRALAEERYLMYRDMFGDDLYVEFHPTDITHDYDRKVGGFVPVDQCVCDGNKQRAYNLFLKEMINKYGGKAIPVTDAHFIKPEDKIIQDCLLKNGNANGWYFYESYHAKEAEEVYQKLVSHLGTDWLTRERFQAWIENTYEVMEAAKRIDVEFQYHLPEIEIPSHIEGDSYDEKTENYLLYLCKKHGRWSEDPEYVQRFRDEVKVFRHNGKLNFIPYFLLYEDICSYARSIGELVGPGRGSAAGSLVLYYLKVTALDPIVHKLPFERFLSQARINVGKFPDVDTDFSDREPILTYLKQKYGDGFAQICTYQTMKVKNAIYDAMWSLYQKNRRDPEVMDVTLSIPDSPQGIPELDFIYGFTDKEGNYHEGLIETEPKVAAFFTKYPEVERMVQRLVGVVRNVGRHASAYVISTLHLAQGKTPLMTVGGAECTQFDAPMIEANGLVKADLLGVKTIAMIRDCVRLVKERSGKDYLETDEKGIELLYRLPEDNAVYDDFYACDTDSGFQFNTPLIKGYLKKFNPRNREHLADMTALCRPGALDALVTNQDVKAEDGVSAANFYMDVRNGKRRVSYLHPDLAPFTSNGVFVYQEQIQGFLTDVIGYSKEESDQIREGIGKKKLKLVEAAFDRIRATCASKGWSEETIAALLQQIQAFSQYSFNRSHARCYAEIGYITIYLKHHHPLEWWTAVLNNTEGSNKEEKIRSYIGLIGHLLIPPSITRPSSQFMIHESQIMCPLSAIKGVGEVALEELVAKGPFTSLDDYIDRVDHRKANAGVFHALVRARAFDAFIPEVDYLQGRRRLMEHYAKRRKAKTLDIESVCSSAIGAFLAEMRTNTCFSKTIGQTLNYKTTTVSQAEDFVEKGKQADVEMVLIHLDSEIKSGTTKTGKPYRMQKSTLTDGHKTIESVVWDAERHLSLNEGDVVYVRGRISKGWATKVQISIHAIEEVKV